MTSFQTRRLHDACPCTAFGSAGTTERIAWQCSQTLVPARVEGPGRQHAVQKLLPEQGLLEDQERWLAVLRFFDEVEDFGARLDARWAAQPADQGPGVSAARWQELEAEVAKVAKVTCLNPALRLFVRLCSGSIALAR